MIFTECCYCEEPFVYSYESGDMGGGGFAKVKCEKCGNLNWWNWFLLAEKL